MSPNTLQFIVTCMALGNFDLYNALGPLHQATCRFALVKYGGGVVQMSGSVAGNTHARNRFGNYIRARTTPVNPNSSRQTKMRSIMATLVERWNDTLSNAQRTAWNLYASSVNWLNALGETVKLTGFNHYVRSNAWQLDLGFAPEDDGPTTFALPGTDGTIACSSSEATQLITVTFDDTRDWCSEDAAGLMILEGRPTLATRNFFGGPYRGRSAKMGSAAVPIVSPQTYTSIWPITEGQKVWSKFRILRADGRLSTDFITDHVVAA